jgi:hypothetical protein
MVVILCTLCIALVASCVVMPVDIQQHAIKHDSDEEEEEHLPFIPSSHLLVLNRV